MKTFSTSQTAAERGSADAYYGRYPNPHIWLDQKVDKRQELTSSDPRYHEYLDAFYAQEDFKDWE